MYNQKMCELGSAGSAIRELFEYGKKRKLEVGADKVYDFSLGNPNVPAPKIVNETLINLINNTDPAFLHGYTSASGDLKVRESIATYLNETYGAALDYKLIHMTSGAAPAITATCMGLLNEGEEVIAFAPFFPEYKVFVENAGGVLKIVKCLEPSFDIDYVALDKAISPKTKIVMINYPNNPTGVVIKPEGMKKLVDVLNKKQKEYNHPIYLFSDEPYRELIYDDELKYQFVTNYYDNSIVGYSFSKSISFPGERIGYVAVNPKCEDNSNVFRSIVGAARSMGYVCASSMFQYMIPYIQGYTSDLSVYKKNRDLFYTELISYGYEVVPAEGAFYLFIKALGGDAKKFSEFAKKYDLLIVPSDSFGYPGYIRISYCVSYEEIKRSLPVFKQVIEDYKKGLMYE